MNGIVPLLLVNVYKTGLTKYQSQQNFHSYNTQQEIFLLSFGLTHLPLSQDILKK